MKTTLRKLFDYQKFQKNTCLATIIADTESRYDGTLSDEDLSQVSAAGEVVSTKTSDINLDCFEEGL